MPRPGGASSSCRRPARRATGFPPTIRRPRRRSWCGCCAKKPKSYDPRMKFLVFIEQREGKIRKASLEALALARRLAGGPVAAVLPGKGVAALAGDLGKYGAGTVYVADRDELELYSNKGYVGALDAAAQKEAP